MNTIYPFELATSNLKLANLSNSIFKKNGLSKKDALLQLSRYAEKFNLNYSELVRLFSKNLTFYQLQYKNSANLSQKEIAKKEANAFELSVQKAATQSWLTTFAIENNSKKFIWLPSSSKNPRDLHQIFYGKTYFFADPPLGTLPGEAPNCRCGLRILD